MATVRKSAYTKPLPPDAEIVEKKKRKYARFKHNNRTITAPLTRNGKGVRIQTDEWYARYKDENGNWKEKKGYTDKDATLTLAIKLERQAARAKEGLVDPFEEHHRKPIGHHLKDFRTSLEAKEFAPKHIGQVVGKATNMLATDTFTVPVREPDKEGVLRTKSKTVDGCGCKRITEIDAFRVESALRGLREAGLSIQTCKHYLAACKQFVNWLTLHRRLSHSPIQHLEPGNVDLDRRRERRALVVEEIERLLKTTASSAATYRGLAGKDRHAIYCLALGSGLRAAEIASLKPESFALDADTPHVIVEAGTSKRRQRDEQALPPDVVAVLRKYLAGTRAGKLLWPGSWRCRAAEMLRIDLEAAGIPYVNEAGEVVDFHGHRHTYITVAAKTVPTRMAQELARHSTPLLTQRYTHLELHDTGAAAAQLPPLMPKRQPEVQQKRATGTEGKSEGGSPKNCSGAPQRPPTAPQGSGQAVQNGANEKPKTTTEEEEEESPQVLTLQRKPLTERRMGRDSNPRTPYDVSSFQDNRTDRTNQKTRNVLGQSPPAAPPPAPQGSNQDPDLERIVRRWDSLPDHIRQAVLALVNSAGE